MTRRIQDPVAGGGSRADKPLLALGGIYQTDREREAAAAPALLAALQMISEHIIVVTPAGYTLIGLSPEQVKRAVNAIAAAKGEV